MTSRWLTVTISVNTPALHQPLQDPALVSEGTDVLGKHNLLAYLLYGNSLSFLSLMLVWSSFSSPYYHTASHPTPFFCLFVCFLIKELSGKPVGSCLQNQKVKKAEKLKRRLSVRSSAKAILPTFMEQLSKPFSVRNMSYGDTCPENMQEKGRLKKHVGSFLLLWYRGKT